VAMSVERLSVRMRGLVSRPGRRSITSAKHHPAPAKNFG
jgi:hypothetical protein